MPSKDAPEHIGINELAAMLEKVGAKPVTPAMVNDAAQAADGAAELVNYKRLVDASEDMEAQLRARSEELQARNRKVLDMMAGRNRFFRNVSHELRTPLTSIIGFAELLLEDTNEPLSDNQRQLLKRVVDNSHKLLAMVSDLLDLSKIEAGRAEVNLDSVDLGEFISQADRKSVV